MDWRYFDAAQDLDAAVRIWHESGWLNRHDAQACASMKSYTASARGYAGLVHERPECFVFRSPGTLRHLRDDVSLSAIIGVATGRNGRKQGLAARLTARALAEAAAEGVALAGLSTFELGFYDRLGFGTAAYENVWRFDPDRLTVSDKVRPPHHLTSDQAEAMHDARLKRKRHHGSVSLSSAELTRAAVLRIPNGFGLGYFDDPEETPSHFLWCGTAEPMRGPYVVEFMAWKTPDQLRELLGLITQWGDQVRLVVLTEPPGIQLQDFVYRPTQHSLSTNGGEFASGCRARANFQYRMLNLKACIAATRLPGPAVSFNLILDDPVLAWPVEGVDWRGLSGTYRVTLGPESFVEDGADDALPALSALSASVGAFTRLWLGVRPATGLALTDALSGPPGLLEALDEALRMPVPQTDWAF